MGFWSTVGSVASSVGNHLKEQHKEVERLKNEYQNERDSYLVKKAFGSRVTEKMAAMSILKDRGYHGESLMQLHLENK